MSIQFTHRRRSKLALLMLGALCTVSAVRVAAQTAPPRLLSYQGVLSDDKRTAVVDGNYAMTFRIYDRESGGSPLWEERSTVATIDGVFETILGITTPIVLPFDRPYWLALELQGEAEMAPRVQLVSAPYSFRSLISDNAMGLDANATGVVHTLNALAGNLVLIGEGLASVRVSGDTLAVVVPQLLPTTPRDGQFIRWNAGTGAWEAVDPRADTTIATTARLSGRGTTSAPLDIARMGATDGQPLVWNDAAQAWQPGESGVQAMAPILGDGTTSSPLHLQEGTVDRQGLIWDAAAGRWTAAEQSVRSTEEVTGNGTAATPLRLAQQGATRGQVLRWDETARGWRPGAPITAVTAPLRGSGITGDPLALEPGSSPGQLLHWNGVQWTAMPTRMPMNGEVLRWNGATGTWEPAGIVVTNAVPLTSGAIWYGNASNVAAELPGGTPNQVLAVNAAGTRPSWTSTLTVDSVAAKGMKTIGDVAVGGSLSVAGPSVNLPAGSIDNTELANDSIMLAYGPGVAGDAAVALGGTLNVRNTGVLSVTGTTNQVMASAATGDVTLSLPQNIHTDASPRFDGLTLDNLVTTSTSDSLLVMSGGVVQSRTAQSFASTFAPFFWSTLGNPGTTPATNFLGTTDNQPLELRVNNQRVMRYEPNTVGPNIVGGYLSNSVAAGVSTATIAGGGEVGLINTIAANRGTIGGGARNSIASGAHTGTIAGGGTNIIQANAYSSTIGGGAVNTILAGADMSTIAGGTNNSVSVRRGSIGGGEANSIAAEAGTIGGGGANAIHSAAFNSTIGGGANNVIRQSADMSTISGGQGNIIDTLAFRSTIGGGTSNLIDNGATLSTISGGGSNSVLVTGSTVD
jgi:hypothetical protein